MKAQRREEVWLILVPRVQSPEGGGVGWDVARRWGPFLGWS